MAKHIKVTDGESVGYHSVEDDFKLPNAAAHESYEFVSAAGARMEHPALFGKEPAAASPAKADAPAKPAAKADAPAKPAK